MQCTRNVERVEMNLTREKGTESTEWNKEKNTTRTRIYTALALYVPGFIVCTWVDWENERKKSARIKPIHRLHVLVNENVCCCYSRGCRRCRPRCRRCYCCSLVYCVVVCFIGFHASIFNRTPDCVCVIAYGANSAIFRFFSFFVWIWQWASKWMMMLDDRWCKMHYFRLSCQCAHNNITFVRTA